MLCNNYRGISIMDTFAKLYDTLILNRLKLWCEISKCQAGAQKKRSCIEQSWHYVFYAITLFLKRFNYMFFLLTLVRLTTVYQGRK